MRRQDILMVRLREVSLSLSYFQDLHLIVVVQLIITLGTIWYFPLFYVHYDKTMENNKGKIESQHIHLCTENYIILLWQHIVSIKLLLLLYCRKFMDTKLSYFDSEV